MPELPEVETLRLMIEPRVLGAHVKSVDIHRRDVIDCESEVLKPQHLLSGDVIASTCRKGKQLALIGKSGRVLVVQLGMTGDLFCESRDQNNSHTHVHCVWKLLTADGMPARMVFRDPRRFGGIVCLASVLKLEERWSKLGPDGLYLKHNELAEELRASVRAIKAALLDQNVVAGIGNIYADEILFACGIKPTRKAGKVTEEELVNLAMETRRILKAAVAARGSTIRDYRDGDGNPGNNQKSFKVYGRGDLPCFRCGTKLVTQTIAQRTSVWCRECQR